jgi:hypothetical protein
LVGIDASNYITNTNTNTTANISATTNNWIGGNGNWSVANNWSLGRLPSSLNDNITIKGGKLIMDVDYTVGSDRLFTISDSGSMEINPGKTITIDGLTDFGNNSVTLKSSADASGSIGKIKTGKLMGEGNITVERFISGQSVKGRFRFLSSPIVYQFVFDLMESFFVTGPGDSIAANAVNGTTLGTPNTNGFHTNYANILFPSSTMANAPQSVKTSSVRGYNERVITGGINGGWFNMSPSSSLGAGIGFRAYIRGDKNIPNAAIDQLGINANSNIQGSVNIKLTGGIYTGDINAAPRFTSSGVLADDGWNLLGNPYPCSYDFVAHVNGGSSVFDKINPTIYVYSGITGGYVSYNALSNTSLNLDNGIIPVGTGFFVKANAPNPKFIFKEDYKTSVSHIKGGLHKTINKDEFGIKFYKDSTESDLLLIKLFQGATNNAEQLDIIKMPNDNLNLSAYGQDSILLSASLIPPVVEETRIKLNIDANEKGNYNFEFKNMENFQNNISVHLFDRYTNQIIDAKKHNNYTFDLGTNINQIGNNRFELILNLSKSSLDEINELQQAQILVYQTQQMTI